MRKSTHATATTPPGVFALLLALTSWVMPASAQNTAPSKGQYATNTPSGPITAKSGQIIEGLQISNPSGPCVFIPPGVSGVTIRNNDIGPCGESETSSNIADWFGDVGIEIMGSRVVIEHNTIHDVRTAIAAGGASGAKHPITIARNLAWDIRGPMPRGQFIQFGHVIDSEGDGQTTIIGNISDKYLSEHPTRYEDHVNLFGSQGTPSAPMVVACNKFRGGDSGSGSGMIIGDDGGGWADIRDNIFVMTTNVGGVGCASCHDTIIQRNWVYARGADAASLTGGAFYVHLDSDPGEAHPVAQNVTFKENRAHTRNWLWGGSGETSGGIDDDYTGINVSYIDNQFQDASLTEDIWHQTPRACQ